MTKDEALKKYAAEIVENDHLGLGQALVARMEDDKLFKFAVSGLVKEVYTLQEKLSEAEAYSDQREMEYTKTCDSLHEKLRIAVSAFREITENFSMDEGHRMFEVANEALKMLPNYQGEGTQNKDSTIS